MQSIMEKLRQKFAYVRSIQTDTSRQFTSKKWLKTLGDNSIEACVSSIKHPESNELSERIILKIYKKMRLLKETHNSPWHSILQTATYACNNTINRATKHQPSFIIHKHGPTYGNLINPQLMIDSNKRQEIKNNIDSYNKRIEIKRNRTLRQNTTFQVGLMVYLTTKIKEPNRAKKLGSRYKGLYKKNQEVTPVTFELLIPGSDKKRAIYHWSLLKA
jgi:hypothetical protein